MKPAMKIISILVLLIIGSSPIQGKTAGTLVLEKGIVKIRRNFTDRIIRDIGKEVSVNEKDEIQTSRSSRVKILLNQKNETIQLYSNSFFTIATVDEEKSVFSFPIGKIRCLVKPTFAKISRIKRRFRVKTITAIIGVKGTDFVVETNGTATNILTLDGTVNFSSVATPDVVVEVPKNQASTATSTQAPTPPVLVPKETREKITSEDTGQKWEGVEPPKQERPKEKPKDGKAKEGGPQPPPQGQPPPEQLGFDPPIDTRPPMPEDAGEPKDEGDNLGESVNKSIIFTIEEQ